MLLISKILILFMKSMFVQKVGTFALDCFLLLEIEEKTSLENLQARRAV